MNEMGKFKYFVLETTTKEFSEERYNTHVKSCNSILYTKNNSAIYIGLIFGTMCCL